MHCRSTVMSFRKLFLKDSTKTARVLILIQLELAMRAKLTDIELIRPSRNMLIMLIHVSYIYILKYALVSRVDTPPWHGPGGVSM